MKFRNYCIVFIGNIGDKRVLIERELTNLSEIKPNIIDGKGLYVATFSAVINPSEIENQIKYLDISFLLFDLDKENSAWFINKPNIHDGLFGFIKTMTDDKLRDRTEDLLREINMSSNTKDEMNFMSIPRVNNIAIPKIKEITLKDIDNMGLTEKTELFNNLIDKGIENLSENDKKILQKLAI